MKKIMIMVSAVVIGTIAQAASVTWNATAVSTTLPDGSVANGVIAYLFEGSLDTAALDSALKAGTWDATAESGYLYTKNTTSAGAIMQTKIGSFENETVTFSMVIFDAATIAEAGHYKYAEVKDVVFTTANKTAAFATPLQSATWQAVPEPTSGLLMLVGLAGLALRRKRA